MPLMLGRHWSTSALGCGFTFCRNFRALQCCTTGSTKPACLHTLSKAPCVGPAQIFIEWTECFRWEIRLFEVPVTFNPKQGWVGCGWGVQMRLHFHLYRPRRRKAIAGGGEGYLCKCYAPVTGYMHRLLLFFSTGCKFTGFFFFRPRSNKLKTHVIT